MNFQQFLTYDFFECWLFKPWLLWNRNSLNSRILESRIILFSSSLNVSFFRILFLVTIFKIKNILMELFECIFFYSVLHSTADKLHTFHFKISFDCFCLQVHTIIFWQKRRTVCVWNGLLNHETIKRKLWCSGQNGNE